MAAIDPRTGLPLVGQPQAKLAVGLQMAFNDEYVRQFREWVVTADAEQKAEVMILYNDQVAFLTFEAFRDLIFPPLEVPAEISVEP